MRILYHHRIRSKDGQYVHIEELIDAVEEAIRRVWREGLRTEDVAGSGSPILGTREMSERIAEAAHAIGSESVVG